MLYGKLATSSKKRSAFMYWCAGDSFAEIGSKLSVAKATAQVYVIDIIADGKGSENDRLKVLMDMEVTVSLSDPLRVIPSKVA